MNINFLRQKCAFSMVEIMVALLVLSIGLIGMAMMTMMVMRGTKNASLHASATDLCQNSLVKLKDVYWEDLGEATSGDTQLDQRDFGLILGQAFQESDINEFGNTWETQFAVEKAQSGNVCAGEDSAPSSSSSSACAKRLRELGPYVFTRNIVVCKGEDYGSDGTPPAGTSSVAPAVSGVAKPEKEPDCRFKTSDAARPQALTCRTEDISTAFGTGETDKEKVIKLLCAWRDKNGTCSSIALQSTYFDLSL